MIVKKIEPEPEEGNETRVAPGERFLVFGLEPSTLRGGHIRAAGFTCPVKARCFKAAPGAESKTAIKGDG
jgi:hypothetical protein